MSYKMDFMNMTVKPHELTTGNTMKKSGKDISTLLAEGEYIVFGMYSLALPIQDIIQVVEKQGHALITMATSKFTQEKEFTGIKICSLQGQ